MKIRKLKKKWRKLFGKRNVEFKKHAGYLWVRSRISKNISDKYGWEIERLVFIGKNNE